MRRMCNQVRNAFVYLHKLAGRRAPAGGNAELSPDGETAVSTTDVVVLA
jgi:hypothetical protein